MFDKYKIYKDSKIRFLWLVAANEMGQSYNVQGLSSRMVHEWILFVGIASFRFHNCTRIGDLEEKRDKALEFV